MARFPTTRWTLVVGADSSHSPEAREALAALCEAYWRPLYAFVRSRGYGAEDARDLVQGFFARFLAHDDVRRADREKGRFRSYLLGALVHHLSDEDDRARAAKRGGGVEDLPLELDFEDGERRYVDPPSPDPDPQRVYERRWALELLDRVLERLRGRYEEAGQSERFEALVHHVTGQAGPVSYRDLAERLGLTESAIKVSVHRLRARYAELLRREVADTVADPRDVEGELRYLVRVLRGAG